MTAASFDVKNLPSSIRIFRTVVFIQSNSESIHSPCKNIAKRQFADDSRAQSVCTMKRV